MINRSLMIIGFFLLGLALTASANAAPGQRYVVQKDNTKVYKAPSAKSAVVTRLNKGDRVIEWRRQGSWVNISRLGAVGKDGWVKLSRLRTEASEIEIEISPNNQFLVRALVNGKRINFLVDTGAYTVVLRSKDAKKLGFNNVELDYTKRASTAGGFVRAAPIKLDEIRIGQLTVANINAVVNEKDHGMEASLLGMTFLRRLRSYEVVGKQLVLRW